MTIAIERQSIESTFFHSAVVYRKGEVESAETGTMTQTFAAVEEAGDAVSVVADHATDKFTAAAHGLANGTKGRFTGTSLPTGISSGVDYFVVSTAENDFKVALTIGGTAVLFSSNGTAVVFTPIYPVGAVRCALSLTAGSADQGVAEKRIAKGTTLFVEHDANIQIGDRVTVTLEDGRTIDIVVDSLSIYPTHIEAASSLHEAARA